MLLNDGAQTPRKNHSTALVIMFAGFHSFLLIACILSRYSRLNTIQVAVRPRDRSSLRQQDDEHLHGRLRGDAQSTPR